MYSELNEQAMAQLIQQTRKQLNLTQMQLSELSGIAEKTLIKIEKGEMNINFQSLLAVMQALGIKLWIKNN